MNTHRTIICLSVILASTLGASEKPANGSSFGSFTMSGNTLTGETRFLWSDLDRLFSIDTNADGKLTAKEFEQSRLLLGDFGETLYSVNQGETQPESSETNVSYQNEEEIVFSSKFQLSSRAEKKLELEFVAATDFSLNHRHFFRVTDETGSLLLDEISDRSGYHPLFPEAEPLPTEDKPEFPPKRLNAPALSEPAQSPSYFWVVLAAIAGWLGNVIASRLRPDGPLRTRR